MFAGLAVGVFKCLVGVLDSLLWVLIGGCPMIYVS